jgi:TonB family protein
MRLVFFIHRQLSTALVLIFLCSVSLKAGDKRSDAEALFTRANALTQVNESAVVPYTLRGHFRLHSKASTDGTYLRAISAERGNWREEIRLPAYSETLVRKPSGKWVRRDAAVAPEGVRELRRAMNTTWTLLPDDKVTKIVERTLNGATATCAISERGHTVREHCFDRTTGLPLRKRNPNEPLDVVTEYSDYTFAANRQVPRTISVTKEGHPVLEFWVDSISTDAPDSALFEPLPDGKYWPVCEHMKPPVATYTTDPPPLHDMNRVTLQLVVDAKGHPDDVVVATSSGATEFDADAIDAVRKWRFQPAMCGNSPVPFEMEVVVESRVLR